MLWKQVKFFISYPNEKPLKVKCACTLKLRPVLDSKLSSSAHGSKDQSFAVRSTRSVQIQSLKRLHIGFKILKKTRGYAKTKNSKDGILISNPEHSDHGGIVGCKLSACGSQTKRKANKERSNPGEPGAARCQDLAQPGHPSHQAARPPLPICQENTYGTPRKMI